MVKRILLVAVLLSALLAAVACSERETRVEVTYGDFIDDQNATREMSVPEGTMIDVALYSNPTTGFEWEDADISNTAILQQVDRRFLSPRGESDPPTGSPGQDVFAFESIGKGQSTVTFHYSRPWEGGQRSVWTFTLLVNVE